MVSGLNMAAAGGWRAAALTMALVVLAYCAVPQGAGAAAPVPPPALGVMRVRSSPQLYAAFANQSVSLALLEANIFIDEQTWAVPIRLTRSFTVLGVPFANNIYPTIDFNFTLAKVRAKHHVTSK